MWECRNCKATGKIKIRNCARELELNNGEMQFDEFICRDCSGTGAVDNKTHTHQMAGVKAWQNEARNRGRSTRVTGFLPKQIA